MAEPRAVAEALLDLFTAIQLHGGGEHLSRLETEGLSLTQYKALSILNGSDAISVKELATRLVLSAPATSRAVDGLVTRGLVRRAEDDRDRRQRSLRIADPGRRMVHELDELRLAGWERFLRELAPAQLRALHAALEPIVTRQSVTPKQD